MKFKEGDKVKIISNYENGYCDKYIGEICTIGHVDETAKKFPYELKEICCYWEEEGLERVDNMVEVIRKPIYKQAKVAKAIDEYINKGLHKGNIVGVIDNIYNSNDEGEITEIKAGSLKIINGENINIEMTVSHSPTYMQAISKTEAIQLFKAGLEMCEGE